VAMAAGLAALDQLDRRAYSKLEALSAQLEEGLLDSAAKSGVSITVNRVGSMVGLFFAKGEVRNFRDAKASDHVLYPKFHRGLLERGCYFPPSAFETIFLSTAHSVSDVNRTVASARIAFREVAG
ncbi:MAG TPA: hypothetical protein VEC92_02895, partial [Nitrososphaerales archaeon]|nr:hypothetical protein [Nitrososphaerales archaeon]